MKLTEKVAYLKGLMEGMEIDTSKPESKLIKAIVDIIDDMALTVSDLEDECDMLNDYVEELDEDLGELEEEIFGVDEDKEFDDDFDEDEDDEFSDDEFIEVNCPECGEKIFFDENIDPSGVICPSCNTRVDFVCDCCDSDDEKGCHCGHEDECGSAKGKGKKITE